MTNGERENLLNALREYASMTMIRVLAGHRVDLLFPFSCFLWEWPYRYSIEHPGVIVAKNNK
jgi:hypothetical protein